MSSGVAGINVPKVPVPDSPSGVPYIDTIATELAQGIRRYTANLWTSIAPNEPIIKKLYVRRPDAGDFKVDDLPAFYVWPTRVLERKRLADEIVIKKVRLTLMWVYPPAQEVKFQKRLSFWPNIDDALHLMVDPAGSSARQSSEFDGYTIQTLAGLYDAFLGDAEQTTISLGKEGLEVDYFAVAWVFDAVVYQSFDFSDGPVVTPGQDDPSLEEPPVAMQLGIRVVGDSDEEVDEGVLILEGEFGNGPGVEEE